MEAPGPDSPCGLCGAAAAPYTCPRCNRRLCSLGCYRAHGGCSEAFYREQVLQTLRSDRGPPPALPSLGAALRRPRQLREAEASAGCEGRGLWGSLSAAERAAFQRLIRTGEAAKLIPAWRPWWWRRNKGKNQDKYGDKDEDEDEDEPQIAPPPAIPSSIPALSSFPAPPPSPLLRFQLPNVLFGYAFALSLHGGDESLVPELPGAAIDVAAALRMRRAFRSTAEALRAARDDAKGAGYPMGPLGDAGTVLAVAELLEGPGDNSENYTQNNAANYNNNYVIMALAHLEQLLSRGQLNLDANERQTFVNAQRKCRFLMSWSQEAPMGTMVELARETREVVNELISANEGMGQGEIFSANEGRGRRLIEELD
ncbi:zinc finger HIT domain-containing protein 2 [Columba livia]|uniref:zinc finger HIT domain-containing protein 2 n=1 Tax=Columba livia TaxID=8932 RepID=UPI0031BA55C7